MKIEAQSPAYLAEVEKVLDLEGLSPETAAAICEPQILFVTEEYRKAPVKVMIVGQETGAIDTWLASAAAEGLESVVARQRLEFEKFNFAVGTEYNRAPFWRAVDAVCEAFGLQSRQSVAWSNISKVTLGQAVSDSVSIEGLPAEARMEIVRWQREMARAEIEYAKPDVIVHFTGGMRWIAGHTYKSGISPETSDVAFHVIDGAGASTGYMTAPFLGNAISVFTYHPNGGRTSEAKARTVAERKIAIDWAARKFSERSA